MAFPKPNQQMLLLLSEKNPMWRVLLAPLPVTQENIVKVSQKARNVLAVWRRGIVAKPSTCEEIFECIQARIDWGWAEPARNENGSPKFGHLHSCRKLAEAERASLSRTLAEYKAGCEKGIKTYELAAILSLSIEECQKIIDDLIYEARPLFPSIYYGKEENERDRAQADFEDIGGFYHLWARRGELWLKAALRVRYVLDMRGGKAIRVKMNFPLFHAEEEKYREYDGFVVTRDAARKLYWVFEKRKMIKGDYWYMITSANMRQNYKGNLVLAGTYLTTGQDENMSIVASDVVLQRQKPMPIEAVADLMHTTTRIIGQGDPEWDVPEAMLKAARNGNGSPSPLEARTGVEAFSGRGVAAQGVDGLPGASAA